ncbi:MAG: helix-turn-helix domain-containing protein [Pseudomonadota bacterium]
MATQETRRTATRAAILNSAVSLFGEAGFEATTTEQIAVRAGVAKGSIYHHFKSKRDIFEAAFEAVSSNIVTAMIENALPSDDTIGTLVQSMRQFFNLCAEPVTSRILLQDGPAVLGFEGWRRLDALHFGGLVTAALSSAMDAGAIRQQPLGTLSQILLAGIQAAAIDCAAQADFERAASEYLVTFEAILRGLR